MRWEPFNITDILEFLLRSCALEDIHSQRLLNVAFATGIQVEFSSFVEFWICSFVLSTFVYRDAHSPAL